MPTKLSDGGLYAFFQAAIKFSGPWVLGIKPQDINLLSSCFVIVDQFLFIAQNWN